MSLPRLLMVLALTVSQVRATDLIPVESFAAGAAFSRARLSPDGEAIAYLTEVDGSPRLMILDINNKTVVRIEPGRPRNGMRREVPAFQWVSEKRIAFVTTLWDGAVLTGVSAVDRDGNNWKAFTGPDATVPEARPLLAKTIIHSFDDKAQSVLMIDLGTYSEGDRMYPGVVKVSTLSGAFEKVVENPGNVVHWGVDRRGDVRLGITREGTRYGAIYRDQGSEAWRRLPDFDGEVGAVTPLGFDYDDRHLLVVATTEEGRRGIYYYDPVEGRLGELIASHREFDLIPEAGHLSVDGVSLNGPIASELVQTVIGVRYVTEGPRVHWLDPSMERLQALVNQALPGTVNLIASRSRDERRFLILAFSDRDPGTYHLLDLRGEQPSLIRVGTRHPAIAPEKMAPMLTVSYQARDGERIHGYLTLPVGAGRTNLPMVVMPHGGPRVRDAWGYDPQVQFLASRGYGVLQMNFRGSPGYGRDFYEKGRKEIGRAIQADIEDGARWAIESGIADPNRVAIVGSSDGGFSALYALAHSPGLYRCGVSFAGVTDWNEIIQGRRGEEYKVAYDHFQEWIGDPKNDASFLASISPVNFAAKIESPVLIMQGKDDRTVPPRQARSLVAALKKAKRPPRVLYFSNEGHGIRDEKNRAKALRELEMFLAEHLAPAGAR